MNEHGKVQVNQSEVLVAVGARVVLQLKFLDDSGLGEPVLKLLKKKILVEYGECLFSGCYRIRQFL